MNRIFVAKKPLFISSNVFLSKLKRKYNVKKAGFSGILDPFACGVLVVAFGQYTKLFHFLQKSPKVYKATLWLGLQSDSLDLENVRNVQKTMPLDESKVREVLQSFLGEVRFVPPNFSAKKINGKKAYEFARNGKLEILKEGLKEQTMQVFKIEFLNYSHPFISFRTAVSEGAYIRSLGALIAEKLGCIGSLSYLERESEGGLCFKEERALNPLEILPFTRIDLRGDFKMRNCIENGKKFNPKLLKISENTKYIVQFEDFFSIISSKNESVQYLANRIPLC
ncbi:tRNA pseudouridine(55) synthase TruB [Helicobacter turcicus]|uniref:tRNA pseudouridine synthase B n=1 Tax=Helicobacter turcicus TaxID=2867412 RepID=A0ABS7JKW9_9HELI|nr:tRNA pseudouridine(55) synthase TruB [Helicobacter turcicus]MBX7490038.1 tRNA pseudouridine(55) synthase TruB [Helicobacter turcicus]MBX7544897.1 tRNA pseudouridine(55) synthase TruB [Helicobacter turcicus]